MSYLHQHITEKIIKCYYQVYNTLGYRFLEKVYHNAMLIELRKDGLQAQSEVPTKVFYDGQKVGNYTADIIVEESVIVELKAKEVIHQDHEYQLINYLKATEIEVGLLLNFGKKPEFRRKIYSLEHR